MKRQKQNNWTFFFENQDNHFVVLYTGQCPKILDEWRDEQTNFQLNLFRLTKIFESKYFLKISAKKYHLSSSSVNLTKYARMDKITIKDYLDFSSLEGRSRSLVKK